MNLEAIKAMWARGDYAHVGDWFRDASVACLEGLELEGRRVLDVGCGTGAVAIAAANRGAHAHGIDLVPAMLEEAQRRAQAAGVQVSWHEGTFTDLSAYREFDVATSAFAVMFAPDARAAAEQLATTLTAGGVASIAAWAPDGAFGQMAPEIGRLLPELEQGPKPARWATRQGLEEITSGLSISVGHVVQHSLQIPFPSVWTAATQMRTLSGPWMMLFDLLEGRGADEAAFEALTAHLEAFSTPAPHGINLVVKYAIAHLQPA